MITTTLTEEYDTLLEAIAPEYLRGKKLTSRRIEWAIQKLNQQVPPPNPTEKAGRPTSDETKLGEQA